MSKTLLPSGAQVGDEVHMRGVWWRVEKIGTLMAVLRARDTPE